MRKSYLIINISNTFDGQTNLENHIYQTIKTGEGHHGIGLSNVRRVVEKYNGEILFEDKDNVFTVSAMLALEG
ncbi:MAG: GHKL domain-containing protein [Oscillospiraceae bacterium]